MKITTNRDLYLALTELTKAHSDTDRSLESYLLALRQLTSKHSDKESLGLDEFYSLLQDSFTVQPPDFDNRWIHDVVDEPDETTYLGWLATITQQIVDLHEMELSGALQDEQRYFGIDSPRGRRWYNFNPCGYLECAMAGSMGGWEPDDESGRKFVLGSVAVLDENDDLVVVSPEEIPRPVFEVTTVTWALFSDFLICGQIYE